MEKKGGKERRRGEIYMDVAEIHRMQTLEQNMSEVSLAVLDIDKELREFGVGRVQGDRCRRKTWRWQGLVIWGFCDVLE
jgi:hypothetical protein